MIFFFSSRRRHTRYIGDWSSDVCSSDLAEEPVGRKLSDLAITPDGRLLLATDEEAGELIVLSCREAALAVVGRLKVGRAPDRKSVVEGKSVEPRSAHSSVEGISRGRLTA